MSERAARVAWIVTCEHAGRRVPAEYRALFAGKETLVDSHRGWDPGAATLARDLAAALDAPLFVAHTTRLLVDANRSETNRGVFSDATRGLPPQERERLLARWHRPHRARVLAAARSLGRRGRPVVHLAAHSFTPVLDGVERDVDVGLLYDPARPLERRLASAWSAALVGQFPGLRVRRNRPYLGKSDGLTAALRRELPDARYAGIEIEVNQAISSGRPSEWRALRAALCAPPPTEQWLPTSRR